MLGEDVSGEVVLEVWQYWQHKVHDPPTSAGRIVDFCIVRGSGSGGWLVQAAVLSMCTVSRMWVQDSGLECGRLHGGAVQRSIPCHPCYVVYCQP